MILITSSFKFYHDDDSFKSFHFFASLQKLVHFDAALKIDEVQNNLLSESPFRVLHYFKHILNFLAAKAAAST